MTDNNASSTSTVNGKSNLEIGQSNQDLIITKGTSNKRKWLITGTVCLVVIALVIAVIVFLTRSDKKITPSATAFSLDDYLLEKFIPHGFNGSWTSGHSLLYTDSSSNLVHLDLNTDKYRILINRNDTLLLRAFDFQLSADGLYLLIAHDYQKLYRHSYIAHYTIIDLISSNRLELTNKPVQLVVWAPVGNSLVYVFENNIYYKKAPTDEAAVAITSTKGYVCNGVPDWVNEEEVFSSNKALWFSPDGKKIVFGRFNDTDVPVMVFPIYGEPGNLISQYPRANIVKYPKAGATNPTVTFHYVDLTNSSIIYDLQTSSTLDKDVILSAVGWSANDVVIGIWLNRVQNKAAIISYNTSTTPVIVSIVKNLQSSIGWLELFTPPVFSSDGSEFALIVSVDQGGDAGSYRHIVLFRIIDGSENAITSGKFVVTKILGWHTNDNLIYYLANTEEDSAVQHLYTISPVTKETRCLTCSLKSENNRSVNCLYNNADASKDLSYYVLSCAGPDVPQVAIYSKDGKKKLTWNNNVHLADFLKDKQMPILKKLSFDIADGFKANVLLRLPPNLDTSGTTKYPMVVNVYGGPDTYQVIDKFVLDWGSYLVSNKSIIYAAIDGRGSGLKGDKIMFAGYRKLGTVEVIDQINVTRLIQESLPYVDPKRTAIWGWSYGGYAAGMALATDTKDVFKCGISVAPVTDWTLYDSVYTERFMGLPTVADNLEAYQAAQLMDKYKGLKDKKYFLIHGTYDDNVHYQQSMLWSKVLEQNDILFRQLTYPDEDHSLSLVRPHLYHSLENFLDECFLEKE